MTGQRFYYVRDGKQQGPVPHAQLQQLASSGQLRPQDLVWQEGTPNWVPAAQVGGLFAAASGGGAPNSPTPFAFKDPLAPASNQPYVDVSRPGPGYPMQPGSRPRRRHSSAFDSRPPAAIFLAWLCTNIIGVSILAAIGLVLTIIGFINTFVVKGQTEPAKYSIKDLETNAKLPDKAWIEITDGVLFWEELVAEMKSDANLVGPVDKSQVVWYYVPLISQDVVTDWANTPFPQNKQDLRVFNYGRARVVVRFSPSQLEKAFPNIVTAFVNKQIKGNTWDSYLPKGTQGSYTGISKKIMDEMQKSVKNQDKNRMLLLIEDGRPMSPMVLGIILLLVGLPLFIPLGIWGIRAAASPRRSRKREADDWEAPGPTTRPSVSPGTATPMPAAASAPVPAPAPAPAWIQAPAPAPTQAGVMYHYSRQGQSHGPVSFAQLKQLAASGQLAPQDMVWTPSFGSQWKPASTVPELFG